MVESGSSQFMFQRAFASRFLGPVVPSSLPALFKCHTTRKSIAVVFLTATISHQPSAKSQEPWAMSQLRWLLSSSHRTQRLHTLYKPIKHIGFNFSTRFQFQESHISLSSVIFRPRSACESFQFHLRWLCFLGWIHWSFYFSLLLHLLLSCTTTVALENGTPPGVPRAITNYIVSILLLSNGNL